MGKSMNITVNTGAFAQELRILNRITGGSKATNPILGYVLLRAENGSLFLSTTNFELSMSTECPAEVREGGSLTFPAKTLLEMLEHLPNADLSIMDNRLACGAYKSRLQTLPPEEFPRIFTPEGEVATFSAQALRFLIQRTAYAISDTTQRYVLKGALFTLSGESMAMVSTDGKRLSVAVAARPSGPDYSVVLPAKTLDMLMAQASTGEVEFSHTDRHIFFEWGKRTLTSHMLDGEFPRYQKIIPKTNNLTVQVERTTLTEVLHRVCLVDDPITMTFSTNQLLVTSRADIGDAEEQIAIRYDGPDIKLSVNGKYVLDFLEQATEPSVTISIKDHMNPLLLTDGADFINVVMTMR